MSTSASRNSCIPSDKSPSIRNRFGVVVDIVAGGRFPGSCVQWLSAGGCFGWECRPAGYPYRRIAGVFADDRPSDNRSIPSLKALECINHQPDSPCLSTTWHITVVEALHRSNSVQQRRDFPQPIVDQRSLGRFVVGLQCSWIEKSALASSLRRTRWEFAWAPIVFVDSMRPGFAFAGWWYRPPLSQTPLPLAGEVGPDPKQEPMDLAIGQRGAAVLDPDPAHPSSPRQTWWWSAHTTVLFGNLPP